MTDIEIMDDDPEVWSFLVPSPYTARLLEFLRAKLPSPITVETGALGGSSGPSDDMFSVSRAESREDLASLLREFAKNAA
jgi:hypothetical protein